MSNEDVRLSKARTQAGWMRVMAEAFIPILFAAILLPLIGELYLVSFEPAPWAAELGAPRAILIKLITYAPALAAAVAVIMLSAVLAEYHAGNFVSARASSSFQLAGIFALAASLLNLLIAPAAIALLGGAAFEWRFDPLDIALMAFAAFVLMIGGVLEAAAAALKAENDQIV